jgi:hypothetical protein
MDLRVPCIVIPLALTIIVVVYSGFQTPCLDYEEDYTYLKGCVACSEWAQDRGFTVQTISEMVARTDHSAQMFSGCMALLLAGSGTALYALSIGGHLVQRAALLVCYVIAGWGLIGLSVWSLRVSGPIHTGFTTQTIVLMCVQLWVAAHMCGKKLASLSALYYLAPLIYMALYIILFLVSPMPTQDCAEDFKIGNNVYAIFQWLFVVNYQLELYLLLGPFAATYGAAKPKPEVELTYAPVPVRQHSRGLRLM